MAAKRIVSLLPSATELIYELGAQDRLMGVTHECTYPEQAREKPRVIRSVFDPDTMTSEQIDQMVSSMVHAGKDLFVVDEENVRRADPDLIIAQGTCAVCSAYTNEVRKMMQILEHRPHVEVLDPHSIDDILESVRVVAGRIGKDEEGERLILSLRHRIDSVKTLNSGNRPNVLCIEWVKPFFTSGHWVPQMVEIAGGVNAVSKTVEHSRKMTMGEVEEADPDIIVMMPCGFDTARATGECASVLAKDSRWRGLRAVRDGNVFAVDANSYFSKPSIRTITGIEVLARIIHPGQQSLSIPDGSFRRLDF